MSDDIGDLINDWFARYRQQIAKHIRQNCTTDESEVERLTNEVFKEAERLLEGPFYDIPLIPLEWLLKIVDTICP